METKTITKEKTVTETYDVYVAQDGTEFRDMEQCRKYEETAVCAVRMRLDFKPLKGNKEDKDQMYYAIEALDGVLENGCDMADYYLWTPKSEDDCKNFLQWAKLKSGGWVDGLAKPEYLKDFTYRSTEVKPNETYIVEHYDGDYISLINKSSFLNAMTKMFDTILA